MSLDLTDTHTHPHNNQETTPLFEEVHLPQAQESSGQTDDTQQQERAMRPSISVTLESELEQGVPWGRDLYTFVTSAAGHMMKTLQKPRKNRPPKRQVNHRRFLHNMIQRKFADIEAANHRLASALYFKEEEKNSMSSPSQKTLMPDHSGSPSKAGCQQDPGKSKACADAGGVSKSGNDLFFDVGEKKQPDSGHLWKVQPKPQSTAKIDQSNGGQKQNQGRRNHRLVESTTVGCRNGADYNKGAELFHREYYDDENPLKATNNILGDTFCSWTEKVKETTVCDSSFIQLGQNMDLSSYLELSPLSVDSCDFSIQLFTDTQAQKSTIDITESQWTDIMDLFGVDGADIEGCVDVEAYLESICACQDDSVGEGDEVGAVDGAFTNQLNSNDGSEVGRWENRYEHGYSCHGDQGSSSDPLLIDHRSSQVLPEEAAEIQFTNLEASPSVNIIPIKHSTSMSHYNISELQAYQSPQHESPCMLANCEKNPDFTPFQGFAQSFSVPVPLNLEYRPIPTPPHEADWPFTDILQDRRSPDC